MKTQDVLRSVAIGMTILLSASIGWSITCAIQLSHQKKTIENQTQTIGEATQKVIVLEDQKRRLQADLDAALTVRKLINEMDQLEHEGNARRRRRLREDGIGSTPTTEPESKHNPTE